MRIREKRFHTNFIGGHREMNKTYRALRSQHTWPKMRREMEEYVKQCKSCQINKTLTSKHMAPKEITTTAERPFEKCFLDVVGKLPVTLEGNKYFLNFQDDSSKYVVAVPIGKQEAETVVLCSDQAAIG